MKATISAVKGTRDILPDEVRSWQKAEAICRETFEAYGYREIRAPIIEYTELFEKGTGETTDIVSKEMYTFQDKGGRSLTLRPEYTPSIVRAIIEHRLYLHPFPLRFYYMGPMFRYDKPQKGRYRQFHQVDIEVFGESDPAVDAEVLEMAAFLLDRLGVRGTETLINSVGCPACRPGFITLVREHAAKVKPLLCPDCQRRLETNPLRIFDCKLPGCQEQTLLFPRIIDHLCSECAAHFEDFRRWLEFYGLRYRVEPRLVRGLDYYTRTTFEIVTAELGTQNAILGGGRYDHLMKLYGGPEICGIGFAMGMERLLSVAHLNVEQDRFFYLACLGDEARQAGLRLTRKLRHSGIPSLLEYKEKNLKSLLGRANKLGATWTIIIGEEEVARARCLIKEMDSGEQRAVSIEEVVPLLQELRAGSKRLSDLPSLETSLP